jgi:hypothetical protein
MPMMERPKINDKGNNQGLASIWQIQDCNKEPTAMDILWISQQIKIKPPKFLIPIYRIGT